MNANRMSPFYAPSYGPSHVPSYAPFHAPSYAPSHAPSYAPPAPKYTISYTTGSGNTANLTVNISPGQQVTVPSGHSAAFTNPTLANLWMGNRYVPVSSFFEPAKGCPSPSVCSVGAGTNFGTDGFFVWELTAAYCNGLICTGVPVSHPHANIFNLYVHEMSTPGSFRLQVAPGSQAAFPIKQVQLDALGCLIKNSSTAAWELTLIYTVTSNAEWIWNLNVLS